MTEATCFASISPHLICFGGYLVDNKIGIAKLYPDK